MTTNEDIQKLYGTMPKVHRLVSADISRMKDEASGKSYGGQPTGGATQAMFAVLQGLVNREDPRIYLSYSDFPGFTSFDLSWLDYYEKRFRIPVKRLRDPYRLFDLFGDYVQGVVLYDPKMPNTINPAVMVGGRRSALPVTPTLQRALRKKYGWASNVIDDFRGRFKNDYEINLWSHRQLQPDCHRHIIWQQPGMVPFNYDYIVAKNAFLFCGSHNMKDRLEAALADRIYQAADRPCHVMGWLDERTQELEYTGRISKNGCFLTCNGQSPNLTIHGGIDATPKAKIRPLASAQKRVERAVYVAFVMSDGDALWCLNRFFGGTFLHKKRGQLPISWEIQMLGHTLAPGMLQYYFESMTKNNYPLAAVSGIGYTYPNLHPDPLPYLQLSERYAQMTGLRHFYVGLSNPYGAHYWRDRDKEVDRMVRLYRRHVPSIKGYIRHYGGGGYAETHDLDPGQAPVICATVLAGKPGDTLECVDQALLAGQEARPLFVMVHHTPWGPTLETLEKKIRDLKKQGHKVVLVDEWFAKLEAARRKGWLKGGLYPNREEILARTARDSRQNWKQATRGQFEAVLKKSLLPASQLERMVMTFPRIWGGGQPINERKRTVTRLEDDLAFSVLFTAQVLAAFVATCRGHHLTDLAELARYYRTLGRHVQDVGVVAECLTAFLNWEKRRISIRQAQAWARRLLALLPRLDADLEAIEEGECR